jgi:hypothetical protein
MVHLLSVLTTRGDYQTGEAVEYVISMTAGVTYLACPADGGAFTGPVHVTLHRHARLDLLPGG